MYYAKQSLVLFIAAIIVNIASMILWIVPLIGWTLAGIAQLLVLLLWIISWIYALSGEMKEVPVIGSYARSIKL